MPKVKQSIPTYDLNDISQRGFIVERMDDRIKHPEETFVDKGVHRDSHYIFTFMKSGHVRMMVDFNRVEAEGASMFCVLPGQVHQGLLMKDVSGWFAAVKTDLVPDTVRVVFEETLTEIEPLPVEEKCLDLLNSSAEVLNKCCTDEIFSAQRGNLVIRSLLNAFTEMFALIYTQNTSPEISNESRSFQLTRAFRILVRKNFKTLKSPSDYAGLLNISRSYLTEVIREVTGKSAQYWIHQEILIEAKRSLFFTHLTVKEIAYELGYNDHAYFTRLFSKLEGKSPSEFRDINQK
ncbi:helix-turn-helix domain-containing protein [Chryseobacterium indologenes]|uniref:AraC family transcriptional regulator n=1 Tax=Chryseobacterium indologenes TaxID=253 RepID=A0A0N0IYA4_CHRID|nr:AraC family transcriptional regulator [Chryseobacterium indologenes]KPE52922.1 AraC family transcriptional regulator [Chryseobacterium indologenes]